MEVGNNAEHNPIHFHGSRRLGFRGRLGVTSMEVGGQRTLPWKSKVGLLMEVVGGDFHGSWWRENTSMEVQGPAFMEVVVSYFHGSQDQTERFHGSPEFRFHGSLFE